MNSDLAGVGSDHGIIHNCIFLTRARTPPGPLQSPSACGEWGGGDDEGWFYLKILKEI